MATRPNLAVHSTAVDKLMPTLQHTNKHNATGKMQSLPLEAEHDHRYRCSSTSHHDCARCQEIKCGSESAQLYGWQATAKYERTHQFVTVLCGKVSCYQNVGLSHDTFCPLRNGTHVDAKTTFTPHPANPWNNMEYYAGNTYRPSSQR